MKMCITWNKLDSALVVWEMKFILGCAMRILHMSETNLPIYFVWIWWHVFRSECLSDLRSCQCSLAFQIVLSLGVIWLILSDQLLSPENDPISKLNGHLGLHYWLVVGIVQSNGLFIFSTISNYMFDCWRLFSTDHISNALVHQLAMHLPVTIIITSFVYVT